MKSCRRCEAPIRWERIKGKNCAVDLDGKLHKPNCARKLDGWKKRKASEDRGRHVAERANAEADRQLRARLNDL